VICKDDFLCSHILGLDGLLLIFGRENADVLGVKWVTCCRCLDSDLLSWVEGGFPPIK
jgi:hypothetical protein